MTKLEAIRNRPGRGITFEEQVRWATDAVKDRRFLLRLVSYVEHREGCPGSLRCTCGLTALLEEQDA